MSTTFEQAREDLAPLVGDSEAFHSKFDSILEARLSELDPDFVEEMLLYYESNTASRWYA